MQGDHRQRKAPRGRRTNRHWQCQIELLPSGMDMDLEERMAETVVNTYSAGEITTDLCRAICVGSSIGDLVGGAEASQQGAGSSKS